MRLKCDFRERNQKFRETVNLKHLYRKELDKVCFYRNAAYSDSKDLAKRPISDKIFKDRAYETARNCQYDEHQRTLASMVNKCFDRKTRSGVSAKRTTGRIVTKASNSKG